MPTNEDFPNPDETGTSVFLTWLRLCDIVGRVGTCIRRETVFSTGSFGRELVQWVQSLPSTLKPSIASERTVGIHTAVHGMHLTYLSTITLMHLNKTAQPLPQASTTAVVAASCTSRIFYDYLLRGSLRFLAGQAGWYIIIAILALAHARKVDSLTHAADHDIAILRAAISEMAQLWPSSKMFKRGIDKLLTASSAPSGDQADGLESPPPLIPDNTGFTPADDVGWREYFPFVSAETSPLIGILLVNSPAMADPDPDFAYNFSAQLDGFIMDPDTFDVDFLAT